MQRTIDETNRKREKQLAYNAEHGITPKQIIKSVDAIMGQTAVADSKKGQEKFYVEKKPDIAADPVVQYMSSKDIREAIEKTRKEMQKAAKALDFIEAARLRDEIKGLEKLLKKKAD